MGSIGDFLLEKFFASHDSSAEPLDYMDGEIKQIKRGRGRPRKNSENSNELEKIKRGIARPRKDSENSNELEKIKRGIARPRKDSQNSNELEKIKRGIARPRKDAENSNELEKIKRGIGRPRKDSENFNEFEKIKRGRGRPRKDSENSNELKGAKRKESPESCLTSEGFGTLEKRSKEEKVPNSSEANKSLEEIENEFKDVGRATGNDYYVEKILDFSVVGDECYFLVKWFYWPECHNSWEPEEHVDQCFQLVVDYFCHNKKKFELYKKFCYESANPEVSNEN